MRPTSSLIRLPFFLLVHCAARASSGDSAINALAWRASNAALLPEASFTFPEKHSESLAGRGEVGICFSGGGSRAFVAAAGQVRALSSLGLVDKVKYSASVSGGSWFNTLWQFWSSGAADEAQLLGPYVPPRALNESFLHDMPSGCCLGAPGQESLWRLLARLLVKSRLDPAYSLDRAWLDATSALFLEPWGVSRDDFMAWNASTVAAIRARNPSNERIQRATFVTPSDLDDDDDAVHETGGGGGATATNNSSLKKPFPIFVGTAVGPTAPGFFGDLAACNRSFTQWQMTPLYVGQPGVANYTFYGNGDAGEKGSKRGDHHQDMREMTVTLGGFVETFAFGSQGMSSSSSSSCDSKSGIQTTLRCVSS